MLPSKLSRRYHLNKRQYLSSKQDDGVAGALPTCVEGEEIRPGPLSNRLSSVGSLESGVTVRRRRRQINNYRNSASAPVGLSLSLQSSFFVSTDCANWRRFESTHVDHLESHKHSFYTEDLSAILTEDSEEEFHSALEEQITKDLEPGTIDPKVLFSVEKRKRSQLFNRELWKKQQPVLASGSSSAGDDDERDCDDDVGDGENESSEYLANNQREQWIRNTSSNFKRRKSRLSFLGRNPVVLLTSESDSSVVHEQKDDESEVDEVQKSPANFEVLSGSKLETVERWIATSPFQSPVVSPVQLPCVHISDSGSSVHDVSERTSKRLNESRRTFAGQVSFSEMSSGSRNSVGLQVSLPDTDSAREEEESSPTQFAEKAIQVDSPGSVAATSSSASSSCKRTKANSRSFRKANMKKNVFGNYLNLSSSSSENNKENETVPTTITVEGSFSSAASPATGAAGDDDTFDRLLRPKNDNRPRVPTSGLAAVPKPTSVTSSDTDQGHEPRFPFAAPYCDQVLLEERATTDAAVKSPPKKSFNFKPKPSSPSTIFSRPAEALANANGSAGVEISPEYSISPKSKERLSIVLIAKSGCDTLSFLSSLSLDSPDRRCHPEAVKYVSNFKRHKNELLKVLFHLFNLKAFAGSLPGDLPISWNSRLTKTAGMCIQRRMVVVKKSNSQSLPQDIRLSRIELSTKVLDSADRLRDTLVHEMCHAAAWIVSGYRDGHGPVWKSWSSKAMAAFGELPIIARCHSYSIRTKYEYRCTKCGYTIGRHSKSLDVTRKCCGYCHGKFELLTKKSSSNGLETAQRTNALPEIAREKYGGLRNAHSQVMQELGKQFSQTNFSS